jgi:hypothetical protein
METKIGKLKRLSKESSTKNEQVLSYFYDIVGSALSSTTEETFDEKLIQFMKERVTYANKFVNKKKSKIVEEEIYCLTLLSYTFLNGKFKVAIENNKLILNE